MKLNKCPGDVCETTPGRRYDKRKLVFIMAFMALFLVLYVSLKHYKYEEGPEIVIVDDTK